MFNNLIHLYTFIDQTMAELFHRFPQEVKCGRGCTDCCHAVFDVSFIEASFMARTFIELPRNQQEDIRQNAEEAAEKWQEMINNDDKPANSRIRCPLLSADGTCACYMARPVNCRTYGVPTVINGNGHVCGLSGFNKGSSYPTIDLMPLQKSLLEYSIAASDENFGARRWPLAMVLLHPEKFS